jgi:hypothetical protein
MKMGRRSVGARWPQWRAGQFDAALQWAEQSVASGRGGPEATHRLTLARSLLGDLRGAIESYRTLPGSYPRRAELDEPILWAHLHSGDLPAAREFARTRGLLRHREVAVRVEQAVDHPLSIELTGAHVAEVPFTDDPLTPLMPGLAGRINGHDVIFRLDTGGSFIHLDSATARSYGITAVPVGRHFAALTHHHVSYGLVDLSLGPVRGRHVPVAVHHNALPTAQIAADFGVPFGPIIGTNLLRPFLATIDGPERRLLLSDRNDPVGRARHLTRLPTPTAVIRYGLWCEHRMIAPVGIGTAPEVPMFIDSGLVVATPEHGQAAVLAPRNRLATGTAPHTGSGPFAPLPSLGLGALRRTDLAALSVSARTWRRFGDWGGIDVHGLLSWGYLRHYTWTIDPTHQHYLLS